MNYLPDFTVKLLKNISNTHDLLRATAKISRPGKAKSLLILTIPIKLQQTATLNYFLPDSDYESEYEPINQFSEKILPQLEYHKDRTIFKYHKTEVHQVAKSIVIMVKFDQLKKPTKIYKCDVCEKQFTRHENLWSHKRFCQPNFEFPCGICGQRLKTQKSLNRHVNRVHPPVSQHFCKHCEKPQLNNIFKEHVQFCNSDHDYWCSVCGLRCKDHNILLNHLKTTHHIQN